MKKDSSILKITVLLYLIAIIIPANYYFIKTSIDKMQQGSKTVESLFSISDTLRLFAIAGDSNEKDTHIKNIGLSIDKIEKETINTAQNKEYVELFRIDEIFASIKNDYGMLAGQSGDTSEYIDRLAKGVGHFLKTLQYMNEYKAQTLSDRLLISLALTISIVIVLVFFIRAYIREQLLKDSVHDKTTGLYNKRYYKNMLWNASLLSKRRNSPLSVITVKITNHKELQRSLDKKALEAQIRDFATIFRGFFRHSDTVCRLTEVLFVTIAPDASFSDTEKLVHKLQNELRSKFSQKAIKIEASIGYATQDNEIKREILEDAQKMMDKDPSLKIKAES